MSSRAPRTRESARIFDAESIDFVLSPEEPRLPLRTLSLCLAGMEAAENIHAE